MEFCPECGTMLFPKDNKLTCKCGFEKDLSDTNEYSVEEKIETKETVKVVEDIDKLNPSTNAICPKCGNKRDEGKTFVLFYYTIAFFISSLLRYIAWSAFANTSVNT